MTLSQGTHCLAQLCSCCRIGTAMPWLGAQSVAFLLTHRNGRDRLQGWHDVTLHPKAFCQI